jgi:hypothetical protein
MNPSYRSNDVVIYPSRKRLILMAAGSAVFLTIIWFYSPHKNDDLMLTVHGWIATILGLPLFTLTLMIAVWRLANLEPVLVADGQGLTLNGTFFGPGRLGWNEISGLHIRVVRKQRMLGVDLHEPDKVLARMPAVVRWLARMNISIAGSAFYLPAAIVHYPLEDLVAELEERRAAFDMQYRNAA